jgi:hypothetical protein
MITAEPLATLEAVRDTVDVDEADRPCYDDLRLKLLASCYVYVSASCVLSSPWMITIWSRNSSTSLPSGPGVRS